MSDNLKLWGMFDDIDPKFTKPITGKQYKGTSPNPQYVIKCLTEMFGPVGHGFGWKVLAEGFQPLGDEVLHWCRIWFWTIDETNGTESYGQTKALMKTRNGLMSDEDAPKKSMTDAVVKAASHVGVAANIFLGRWDDQKYVQGVAQEYAKKGQAEKHPAQEAPSQTEIDTAIGVINSKETMQDLVAYWKDLNANAKHVASDQRVIEAKDVRKSEIEAR